MRSYRTILPLLVIALLGASCGGGTKAGGGTTLPATTSTSAAPATTTTSSTVATPTTDPALVAKAAAANLQPADFPVSFVAQPDKGGACPADTSINCSSLAIETVWHDMLTCLGVDDSPTAVQATSPTYLQGLATQARTTVEYTTESSATAIAAAFAGPKLQGCMTSAFNADAKRSAPQGGTPGPSVVTPLAAPLVGQKVSAFRINVTMNLSALQVKIFQDFLVVFNGRTVVRLFFLNPGGGFAPTLEQTLVQKVVSRAGT